MAHNRRLVLGAIDLVKGRIRDCVPTMVRVGRELELCLVEAKFFENAPFRWVGLMLRFGTKTMLVPEYDRLDKKDGELPIAIELEMEKLRHMGREELKQTFMLATLDALIHVGKKYDLPIEVLQAKRSAVYHEGFQPKKERRGEDAITAGLCPNCGKELRTPKSKQCWKCGADWHDDAGKRAFELS